MVVPSKLSTRVSVDHAKSSREKLRNLILLGLPAKERDAILKNLEFIELPTHFELHEAYGRISLVKGDAVPLAFCRIPAATVTLAPGRITFARGVFEQGTIFNRYMDQSKQIERSRECS